MNAKNTKQPQSPDAPPAGLLRHRWVWLLCGVTVVAWQFCFAPFDMAPLAYLALVPWAVAVAAGRGRTAMVAGYLTGVAAFGLGLYWLTWVTMVGYIPMILYLGLFWLVAAWFVRRGTAQRIPLWIVLPIVWVALEFARAYALSGFPWFYLAHSQYRLTMLIQIADVTGAYGVSFLVAMANGLAADGVLWLLGSRVAEPTPARISRRMLIAGATTTVVLAAGMIGYGAFRLHEAEQTCTAGPTVAVVQTAVPISLQRGRAVSEDEWFDELVQLTSQLDGQSLDLILWPETVLPSQFDKNWQLGDWSKIDAEHYTSSDYSDYIESMQQKHRTLAGLLTRLDAPLLAGGMTVWPAETGSGERPDMSNSAMLLEAADASTLEVKGMYHKMHCVPFSEYVPFGRSWPWLHSFLRRFVPEVMVQLVPGERVHRFQFGSGDTTWTTAAPICYEGTFARVCRDMAYGRTGKQIDFLSNLSNDGWFIWPGSHAPSTELDQHLSVYVFRAIENRVPVVRAVNTGVSGFIDSSGRIGVTVTGGDDGTETKMIVGVATEQLLVDSRRSGYSLVGDMASGICTVFALGLGTFLWWRGRRARSGRKNR